MDGGAWWAAVHGVAKGQTRLSDFTFTFTFMHWRRKRSPLQCYCLENPRDRGAWWAAVYGVAQSRTRLSNLAAAAAAAAVQYVYSLWGKEWEQNNSNHLKN